MRNPTIALAVAAALGATAAAQADTTLYGSVRVSADYQKADLFDPEELDQLNDGVWDIVNNSSRLGIRGFEDLGNGLSAIYQYEFGIDVTEGGNIESNRPKLLGLKHDNLGTVSIGTQWTPYYNVAGITDVFNSGRTFGTSYLGEFRKDNSLVYATPNWFGFTAEAMIQMDAGTDREDGIDSWDANVKYQNGPLFAGLGYTSREGDDTPFSAVQVGDGLSRDEIDTQRGSRDQYVVGLGYTIQNFGIGFTGEYGDDNEFGDDVIFPGVDGVFGTADDTVTDGDNSWNYYGTLSYTFGANIVRAAYGIVDRDSGDDIQNYALGLQHNLSRRTRLWVEYVGHNTEEEDLDFTGDSDAVSLGMRHDF